MSDLSATIRTSITEYVNQAKENCLGDCYREKAWGSPLIGFSRGDDPLFRQFKEAIGNFYWTPEEIFAKSFPATTVQAKDLTVLCWVLPHTEATKQGMRQETVYPSKRASLARVNGEEFNFQLRRYVVTLLQNLGYQAVAPVASPFWERRESASLGLASCWSERHAAYASGLGTFSLTDALITPLGMAVRLGSVVANAVLEPTKRQYSSAREYCLYFSTGGCLKCAKRCPGNAITPQGHDKRKCKAYQLAATANYNLRTYGLEANYCGICQSGTPCESRIPVKPKTKENLS
jgi:epoxyqueuosine reductase